MHRLLKIGFQKAGRWIRGQDGLELVLEQFADRSNVLYAFLMNNEVKYVGKTTMPLAKRMYGYLKPGPGQSTNIKNNEKIRCALASGKEVNIYVLADSGLHKIGDFHLNLAAGLEDSLIGTLRPEWNGRGPKVTGAHGKKIEANKENASRRRKPRLKGDSKAGSRARAVHTFHLRPTYMKHGFFNVPVAAEKLYGKDRESMEVLCGRRRQSVAARINRSVNTNNTPRIMGGVALRDWFTTNFKENELAQVVVLTPHRIHITRLK